MSTRTHVNKCKTRKTTLEHKHFSFITTCRFGIPTTVTIVVGPQPWLCEKKCLLCAQKCIRDGRKRCFSCSSPTHIGRTTASTCYTPKEVHIGIHATIRSVVGPAALGMQKKSTRALGKEKMNRRARVGVEGNDQLKKTQKTSRDIRLRTTHYENNLLAL